MVTIKAYTGDLLNRQTQNNKRRHSFFGSPEDEVLFGFSSVFPDDKVKLEENLILRSKVLSNEYPRQKCNNYPRCHEHTVKLFVNKISENVVNRGVVNVLNELEVEYIDNLILSVSGQEVIFYLYFFELLEIKITIPISESITAKELERIWKQMESEVNIDY